MNLKHLNIFEDLNCDYMTKDIKLEAESRSEENGKIKSIRGKGYVPANVYGPDFDNKNIKIKELDFGRVFKAAGESHLIELAIDNKDTLKVIVKDVQKDPVKDTIMHVDFYKVDMDKKITTEIPLNFIGEPKAVKEFGGTLVKNIDTVNVKCLPGNLVDSIDADLSGLDNFHDSIKIKNLKLPEGMEIMEEANEQVASVLEPVKEEEKKEEVEATEEAEGEEGKDLPAQAGEGKKEDDEVREKEEGKKGDKEETGKKDK